MAALAASSGPRNSTLRQAEQLARSNPGAARTLLEDALNSSAGPLVEHHEEDHHGTDTASFVAIGPKQAPVVRCPLFLTDDWQQTMYPVQGMPNVWWAEASTAHRAVRTHYRFLPRSISAAEIQADDPRTSIIAALRAVYELGYPDPTNPEREYPSSAVGMTVPAPYEKWDSVLALPGAAVPAMRSPATRFDTSVERFELYSARLGNTRTVTLWNPPEIDRTTPLPIVVLLDGEDMLYALDAPRIFEALSNEVRPFRAVLVDNATEVSRFTEYPCNPTFVDFFAEELLPAVQDRIAVTSRSEDRIIGGFSFGGLAALWIGWSRPKLFGAVMALSPSMWWAPNAQPEPRKTTAENGGDGEWLTSRFAATDRRPLRVWLSVGLLETRKVTFAPHLDMLSCCRSFHGVLDAKGYEIAGYLEQPSGHEFLGWREGLSRGLHTLLPASRR